MAGFEFPPRLDDSNADCRFSVRQALRRRTLQCLDSLTTASWPSIATAL